ncbi:S-adenosylmethionine decarboxylase proenzyme 1-like [Watersipora subatra]|uniref:S-adenosylmethionine decarboxylase proenzyme 1-like n=1 Tax=Watersipora subatra TaxID=2589382 RepID=UPI00355BDC8A
MPEYFFEGAEKLLEIWFTTNDERLLKRADLRDIKRSDWEKILRLVNCEIISVTKNDSMDAYVLSESSMFVSQYRFILKTCGTTTLLHAIKPILALVKEVCSLDAMEDLFFSRKNFERPQEQTAPHTSFDEEAHWLDKIFPEGAAYSFGKLNANCWHLYTVTPHPVSSAVSAPDQTFELLMNDPDPKVMSHFYKSVSTDGKMATQSSGIDTILPKSVIDEHLFEPCGYSANGLLANGQYWTIHITPEPEFAYVSFETNVPQSNYAELFRKVVSIFRPASTSLTIFANQASVAKDSYREASDNWSVIDTYRRTDFSMSILGNYNLTYSFYKNVYS